MTTVTITTQEDGRIAVKSPWHPDFPKRARTIGGKWSGSKREWTFDPRDEQRARDLCIEIFGTDGTPQDTVTVRIEVQEAWRDVGREYWRFGRRLLERPGRDSSVRLGEGTILLEGQFTSSGGSRANPLIKMKGESVTLEVRDVPRAAVEADGGEYEIVGEEKAEFVTVQLRAALLDQLKIEFPDAGHAEAVEAAVAYLLAHADHL